MPIYLDHNATTPAKPEVLALMADCMREPLNASAIHGYGRTGRKYVETARSIIGKHINCPPAQIIFNSGATEGNNTVLNHFQDDTVMVCATDHVSITEVLPNAHKIPVLSSGLIDLNAFEAQVKTIKPALVSAMFVNNETGVIQPIADIARIAKNNGALFHTDATQALGRIDIDMNALDVDFLTCSAHKLGGAQGMGALCLGICGITPVSIKGGGQEKSARAGTENVAGIAGFGKAVEVISPLPNFQDQLESFITGNGGTVYGFDAPRVSNTTLFSLPSIQAEMALIALDLAGICISNGSACSSGTVKPSHVLTAMGYSEAEALRALRVSTGWTTTQNDIDAFINVFGDTLV